MRLYTVHASHFDDSFFEYVLILMALWILLLDVSTCMDLLCSAFVGQLVFSFALLVCGHHEWFFLCAFSR